MIARTDAFLRLCGMHSDCVDFNVCKKAFIDDMKAGLAGEPSSLMMLPAYLSADGSAEDGTTAIAVDIGGTNLRVARIMIREGRPVILNADVSPVPGSRCEITKEAFFAAIADRLIPILGEKERIGICFSHAAEILPNRDGRLIAFSKEIRVTDSAGMEIAKGLSDELARRGCGEGHQFVLINDTAAVLLSGATGTVERTCGGLLGFVLGTGMNISYVEDTAQIGTLRGSYAKSTMVVNTEAGNFSRVPPGDLDMALDNSTVNPSDHLLEKQTGGRYLGQLLLLIFKQAVEAGLFTEETALSFRKLQELPTPETSRFLDKTDGGGLLAELCRTEGDRVVVSTVIDRLYDRAAKLTALAVAAIIEKTDSGVLPERPACVVAEGSTFYKLYSFREKFERYLNDPVWMSVRRYVQVVSVENAALTGTALAVLLNEKEN